MARLVILNHICMYVCESRSSLLWNKIQIRDHYLQDMCMKENMHIFIYFREQLIFCKIYF